MKEHTIIISNIAEEELESIVNYTYTTFGEKQSTLYLKRIFEGFNKLKNQPDLGHIRTDIPNGFLCFNVEQHSIIYSINKHKKRIDIVRILHSKMDFSNKF